MNDYKNSDCKFRLMIVLVSLAALTVIMSGCATLGKDECLNADWFSIGYEDGARGYKTSRIGDHRRACAKHGVAPDFESYENGRRQGLAEWCTPRNGYAQGSRGKIYNGVCPKEMESAYVNALKRGKAVFDYEKEVRIKDQALKNMTARLDAADKELHDMEAELISDGVSPRRRKALLKEIRRHEEDRRLLLDDISATEHTFQAMQRNLERMKAQNPYR